MKNPHSKGKRKAAMLLLISLLIVTIASRITPLSWQYGETGPEMVVLNPNTGDTNFVYNTSTTSIGARFNATVWLYNVTLMFAYQTLLSVNDTMLNITNAWLPTWDPDWPFYGQSTVRPPTNYRDLNGNNITEAVLIGDSLLIGTPFDGTGLLSIIEFEIIAAPSAGSFSCNLDIDTVDSYALDDFLFEISLIKTGGYYEFIFVPGVPVPPTAAFTYSPITPIVSETVTFNASLSTPNGGSIANYTWNFDDGTPPVTETDPITTHAFLSSGTFNVTLTVIDTEGLNDTAWQTITVSTTIPTIKVDPNYYRTTHIGEVFNVTIKIENLDAASRMIGYQFRIGYNSTFVEVIDMIEGPFLAIFSQSPTPPYTFFMAFDEPPDHPNGSHVVIGNVLLPNATGGYPGPFPQGEGVLAIVTFNVTGTLPGTFNLTLFTMFLGDAMLIDDTLMDIPSTTMDGSFELYALTVTITNEPQAYYGHSSIASMEFVIQYPNSTYYTANELGSITVGVYNGTHYVANISLTTADFDPVTNEWKVEWQIPGDASITSDYSFVIRNHEVTDTAGDSGPLVDVSSTTFNVLPVVPLEVQVDVGEIHFRGEIAEFSVLTLLNGKRFGDNATGITATLYKPDSTTVALSVTYIATGFFKTTYAIPIIDLTGTYTLMVEVGFVTTTTEYSGAAIKSFQISPTLTNWDLMITYINGTTATIETTIGQIQIDLLAIDATLIGIQGDLIVMNTTLGDMYAKINTMNAEILAIDAMLATVNTTVGTIQTSLTNLDARIISVEGMLATVNTTVGTIQTSLTNLDARIISVEGMLATVNTTVGTILTRLDALNTTVTKVDGNIATINTSLGEVQTTLGDVHSAATTTLYVASVLSAIAAIVGIIILLLLMRKK